MIRQFILSLIFLLTCGAVAVVAVKSQTPNDRKVASEQIPDTPAKPRPLTNDSHDPKQGDRNSKADENLNRGGEESGNQLLRTSVEWMTHLPCLTAHVIQRVHLFGVSLEAEGKYFQDKLGKNRYRLELHYSSEQGKVTDIQLNDGRFLYQKRITPQGATLQRIDLVRCERLKPLVKRQKNGTEGPEAPRSLSAKEIASIPIDDSPLAQLNWGSRGGLVHLLASLEENMQFEPASEIELDGLKAVRTIGTWKPNRQQTLQPDYDAPAAVKARMKSQLPLRVAIFFSKEEPLPFFPHRFEFYSLDEKGDQATEVLTMSLEFRAVAFVPELAADLFHPENDSTKLSDNTDEYLKSIRIKRR